MTYSINFADAETPVYAAGRLYLQQIPQPAVSLQLFRNGILQGITPAEAPADGDVFVSFYRY
jgi:hypothetical protein